MQNHQYLYKIAPSVSRETKQTDQLLAAKGRHGEGVIHKGCVAGGANVLQHIPLLTININLHQLVQPPVVSETESTKGDHRDLQSDRRHLERNQCCSRINETVPYKQAFKILTARQGFNYDGSYQDCIHSVLSIF